MAYMLFLYVTKNNLLAILDSEAKIKIFYDT